jgi:hypothetical protein
VRNQNRAALRAESKSRAARGIKARVSRGIKSTLRAESKHALRAESSPRCAGSQSPRCARNQNKRRESMSALCAESKVTDSPGATSLRFSALPAKAMWVTGRSVQIH